MMILVLALAPYWIFDREGSCHNVCNNNANVKSRHDYSTMKESKLTDTDDGAILKDHPRPPVLDS